MDICQGLEDKDDVLLSYLLKVPFLAQVAPAVQVDLLADVWNRHRDAALHEASLLDAAVVYAAFYTAGRVISDELKIPRLWLKAGPQQARFKITGRTHQRLHDLFFAFWDDVDFLSIEELQDLTPEHAREVREMMRLHDEAFEQMEEVLMRCRASPAILTNLEGLLTTEEIVVFTRVLLPGQRTS